MSSKALAGIKVVEIAQGWAGPMAGAIFGDLGADVIKVESIQRVDWWRGAAAGTDDGETHERAWFYNGMNRNKTGITLDLARDAGRDLLLRLVADADVFVENFTTHVVEQLRLTHDQLAAVRPDIISISMPAYGSDTTWRDLPALGTTVESMCGVQSLTGYEDGPPRIQGTSWDPVIGLHATFALLAALHHRRRTGRGQHIEISHIEAGTQLVVPQILDYQVSGKLPPRTGNSSLLLAPHGCYPTTGDDQWITLASRDDADWAAIVYVFGSETLEDPKYDTLASRLEHRHELDADIAAITSTWDRDALWAVLQEAGVPSAPVMSPVDLFGDPHLGERGFFVPIDRAYVGTHLYPGSWIRLDRTPAEFDMPAPTLGEHNEKVLRERLGLNDAEIAALADQKIIGTRPLPQNR